MVEGGGIPKADKTEFKECLQLTWKQPYILRLALSAGIGGLLFGYDTGNTFHYYFCHDVDHLEILCDFFTQEKRKKMDVTFYFCWQYLRI